LIFDCRIQKIPTFVYQIGNMNLDQLIKEAKFKANSGKSINVKQAMSVINNTCGYEAKYETRIGYRDVKPAGQRFVTSRKVVTYYKATIIRNGKVVFAIDSETAMCTAYTVTNFISNL
jgi:hypothetical protein